MKITDEALNELRAKHSRGVRVFSLSDGRDFAFVLASADHFRRANAEMLRGMSGAAGAADAVSVHERIAEELCVWPSPQDFAALRTVAPKVAGEIGLKLVEQAGGGLSIVEGKADASR